MAFAPNAVVDGPTRLSFPYGLFSVVNLAESSTERWENGVTWEALTCDPVAIVVGDCESPEGFPKVFPDGGGPLGEASAFTVYGTYKCGPIGRPLERAQEDARAVLVAREEQAAEARLWATFDDAPTVLDGGNPTQALGQLEAWIASAYGSLGVIHASREAATTLVRYGLIDSRGNQMFTELGTPVVVGSGYPITGAASTETQTVTVTETLAPISGTFTLTLDGATTAPISATGTAADVEAALEAITDQDLTVTGGPFPGAVEVTFATGQVAPLMTADGAGLTNGTVAVAQGTEGGGGEAPTEGSAYIAATPALFGYRSQIFDGSARAGDLLDTRTNDLFGIAERNYLIGYDPCGVAFAQLTLG